MASQVHTTTNPANSIRQPCSAVTNSFPCSLLPDVADSALSGTQSSISYYAKLYQISWTNRLNLSLVTNIAKHKRTKNHDYRLTKWRRMWPESGLSAQHAGFPNKLMFFVASELHCGPDLVVRALVHQAPVDGWKRRRTQHSCNIVVSSYENLNTKPVPVLTASHCLFSMHFPFSQPSTARVQRETTGLRDKPRKMLKFFPVVSKYCSFKICRDKNLRATNSYAHPIKSITYKGSLTAKSPSQTFILKKATAVFAKTFISLQQQTRLIPIGRSLACTLNHISIWKHNVLLQVKYCNYEKSFVTPKQHLQ